MSGPVAQLVAHLHGMQGVRGSNPLRSTKIKSLPFGGGIFHYGCVKSLAIKRFWDWPLVD
jgi:hypothetical protein